MLLVVLSCLACLRFAVASDDEGQKYLAENKARSGVTTRPSGLQYEVLKSGPKEGSSPNATSKCVCHYSGKLLSGEEFDSSYKRGSPATFAPTQVIKGWTEALQLMRPGDKWKLFIPSELGYGDKGAGGKIPGGAVLIFELELIEIKVSSGGFLETLGLDSSPQLLMLVPLGLFFLWNQFGGSGGASGLKQLQLTEALGAEENVKVFFDIKIGAQEDTSRVEMELFAKHFPKTAENFRCLCTGEKGTGKSGKPLHFKGSQFHRVIPGFMAQGGDFTHGNGTGGESIYGAKFEDEFENGYIGHTKAGQLSMANAGKNTNGSQFFLTFGAASHLDGKHVIFGQVTEGMETVKASEKVGSGGGSPKQEVTIVDCGEVRSKST